MNWHSRYLQQARWTSQLRSYLFKKAGLDEAARVLEVGCGTGAVLADLSTKASVFGLDISLPVLGEARRYSSSASLTNADGANLPYQHSVFDIAFCHYLLLWVKNPERVVSEMRRVVRPGGAVLALAEPDYQGRIDYPPAMSQTGKLQIEGLRRQGADPEIGRKLTSIFLRSGLKNIQTGVLGGEWSSRQDKAEADLEWEVLANDLTCLVTNQELQELRSLDEETRKQGDRVLFVPTFFAWGIA